jgi:hypothetical protein
VVAYDRYVAMVTDNRWVTMVANHDLAIAAAGVNRTYNRRRLAGTARLRERIDDSGGLAMVADDWLVAMISDDRAVCHLRAARAAGCVAVVADDRHITVVSDDWRMAMVADHDFAISSAWVDGSHNRRRFAWTAGFRMGVDHLRGSAMVSDDRFTAVVTNDRRSAMIADNRRIAMVANH